jgi:hypothetical protein
LSDIKAIFRSCCPYLNSQLKKQRHHSTNVRSAKKGR